LKTLDQTEIPANGSWTHLDVAVDPPGVLAHARVHVAGRERGRGAVQVHYGARENAREEVARADSEEEHADHARDEDDPDAVHHAVGLVVVELRGDAC
jgi:hypothetical protein